MLLPLSSADKLKLPLIAKGSFTKYAALLLAFIFVIAIFAITGCTESSIDEQNSLTSPENEVSELEEAQEEEAQGASSRRSQSADLRVFQLYGARDYELQEINVPFCIDLAAEYLAMMEAAFDKDDGELWGAPLHTPFILVDPITREAVANQPFPKADLERQGDFYVGILPDDVPIFSTAWDFNGVWWGMMLWEVSPKANNHANYTLRVMIHEAFHANQFDGLIGGRLLGYDDDFFDHNIDINVYARLEITALLRALGSDSDDERLSAIRDALSIREERRQKDLAMTPEDISLTIMEGTALYTDMKMGFKDTVTRLGYLDMYFDHFTRSGDIRLGSSYIFGALYGFLLDEFEKDWTRGIRFSTDPGELLKNAAGITELAPFDELDIDIYGLTYIIESEEERAIIVEEIIDTARSAFLDQPSLRIEITGEMTGDIQAVRVPELGSFGMVFYGDFAFSGVFGTITMTDGFLLLEGGGYEFPAGDIEIDGNLATDITWVLELTDGYEVRERLRGGFEVIAKERS